ncbi:unnamed protein product [Pocillopora meandrina]|uniref:DNA-directed DNA polymerase n=1 Tax=Pocillopora meandrina TaxID=46732 RepID=A0AAU9WQF9_9CNID|nr:unnamed protein product [Pocillopora meandrina]
MLYSTCGSQRRSKKEKKKAKATLKRHRKKNPLASVYEEPPIFVYADFESMIAEDNTHIPVLVCALTSEDDTFETYYGENCTADFLNFLTQLTEDKYGDPRESTSGFDPMEKCATIASACNRYWRKKHLSKDTVAVEPVRGWRGAQVNQSEVALEWLMWQEHQLESDSPRIQHVRNGGEKLIPAGPQAYHVDGFDSHTNTVYEFHGCLFHGCRRCHKDRKKMAFSSGSYTMEALCQQTEDKCQTLRQMGYKVVQIWECQWKEQKKASKEIQDFLKEINLVPQLNPRDAFFGGRTGAASLYYKANTDEGEQIRYVDVTSEYPYVNKYGTYPIGHPEIFLDPDDQDPASYFGILTVDILPPYNLYNPVLPLRHGKKLTFPLCRKCVEDESAKPMLGRNYYCSHGVEDRVLTGTWCTPEIMKAVEKGYQVLRIHEAWHFPPDQRKQGLFAPYVDTWLKIKQESSGYPSWAQTDAQKEDYVKNYKAREGIDLDPQHIKKNPGRKATAKLMLNSFWGKFGEQMNKMKTKQITEPHELIDHLNDTTIEISDVRILSADVIELAYKKIEEDAVKGSKTNIFIAAFTTCQARLKLYESLEALGDRVLYYDTDSVIYTWKPGQTEIPLDPQDERRDTDIVNPRHFRRDPIAKKIKTETQVKKIWFGIRQAGTSRRNI